MGDEVATRKFNNCNLNLPIKLLEHSFWALKPPYDHIPPPPPSPPPLSLRAKWATLHWARSNFRATKYPLLLIYGSKTKKKKKKNSINGSFYYFCSRI